MNQEKIKEAKRHLYFSLIGLGLVLILGLLTTRTPGGLFGEAKLYAILEDIRSHPWAFEFMEFFHHLGSPKVLIPLVGILVAFNLYRKNKLFSLGLILASGGSALFNFLTKLTFQRQRPLDFMLVKEITYSFPSGHAMTNTCLYLFLAYYYGNFINREKKKLAYIVAIIASFIMGFSRVYMGVHYPTDVLAGFMSGYFFYCLTVYILEKNKLRLSLNKNEK